ncbi:unnamed protein product [Cylindrotheca closterium]|uniref:Phosphatidic acid phosphatase type 2/haloperoxidase domain-containing protein n=1 Tax=Cylindrotheca closterium TaxID=2856 RepID=A0AAD2CW22_9STRA|nr:unnamed protein product [Cylindrotheca closterium]
MKANHYNQPDRRMYWERLDEVDKELSEPIFIARLPFYLLEFLLSLPGNWFGSCCFASLTLPSLVAIFVNGGISSEEWYPWYMLVGGLVLMNLTLWILLISPIKSATSKRARILFYGPLTGALAPIIGVIVLAISPLPTMSRNMGYFQVCAWSIGVIPTACLKPLVARQRPASWILHNNHSNAGDERIQLLQKAVQEKHINTLPRMFALDAYASFPSGDTAGAMSSMYALIFLHHPSNPGVRLLGMIFVLLSCFGRMYWMAHHMLDVLMGVLLAYLPCAILAGIFCNYDTGSCQMEWWVPLVGHFMLLLMVISTRLIFNSSVFGSGTLQTDDRDENDDSGTEQKNE